MHGLAVEKGQGGQYCRGMARRWSCARIVPRLRAKFPARAAESTQRCRSSNRYACEVSMAGHLLKHYQSDQSHAPHWPPLLFLVDLYNQALLTMGDDEFFSSSPRTAASSSSSALARNPLSLDEITALSKQLLNIAFTLYWREDQTNVQDSCVPGFANLKWESVRERITKLLQAIHARE